MTIIHLSASPFPVSDAFWIRLKEVLASEPGAAQFAVEVGLPCRERCDRCGQRRGLARAGMHALDIPRLARMRWQRVGRRVPRHRAVKSPPEPIVCGLTAGGEWIRTFSTATQKPAISEAFRASRAAPTWADVVKTFHRLRERGLPDPRIGLAGPSHRRRPGPLLRN